MSSRDETLRRIFKGTGAAERLNDEQKRELLAHLDDAVESKVKSGVAELEAVGQAFAELGDVKKLRFPTSSFRPWSGGTAELGYLLLLGFVGLEVFVLPSVLGMFQQFKAPLPALTLVLHSLGRGMTSGWPLTAAALALLAYGIWRAPREARWRPAFDLSLLLGGAGLIGGALAALVLPFVGIMNGLAR
jgi:hypothetical protein